MKGKSTFFKDLGHLPDFKNFAGIDFHGSVDFGFFVEQILADLVKIREISKN